MAPNYTEEPVIRADDIPHCMVPKRGKRKRKKKEKEKKVGIGGEYNTSS